MIKMKMLMLAMSLTVASGCAENSALIKASSTSVRTDIFEEATSWGSTPKGLAELRITTTLKTHRPGVHSALDTHGTSDYKLLVNIDGQAATLRGSLQKENSEPGNQVDPEAGDGIRYRFSKIVRLKPGPHTVVVAVPDDEVVVAKEITLSEGATSDLVLKPIYCITLEKKRLEPYCTTHFLKGLSGIRLELNGKTL